MAIGIFLKRVTPLEEEAQKAGLSGALQEGNIVVIGGGSSMHAIDPEGLPRGQGPELEDSAVMTPTLHSQALVCFCVFISNKNVQKLKNTKIFKNKKCIQ